MKRFLTLLVGLVATSVCYSAPTYTTYFNNTHTYTNSTTVGTNFAGRGVFTNGITAGASTFTGAVGFADGIAATPSISFSSQVAVGFRLASSNGLYVDSGGSDRIFLGTAGISLASSGVLGWSSTSNPGLAADLLISRDGSAAAQLGSDSATAISQTLKGPDGLGTDKVGGALQLGGGKSTGPAAGGGLIFHTANSAGSSASSLNTYTERFHAPAKWVTLTSATATTIFTIPVPATNYVGLTATVTVYATDGTDHQSKTSVITCDAINKAGTITEQLTQVDNTTAASSGTLTAAYDSVDAGSNVVGIRVAADSSLTETVLRAKIVITAINSNGAATVSEQ